MLKRSIVLRGRLPQSLLAVNHRQDHHQVLVCSSQATSSQRFISTTPSDKNTQQQQQKVATHQQPENLRQERPNKLQTNEAASKDAGGEIYQARLEHLNLWHSVDSIKRLGHRLASLDPLQLTPPDSMKDLSWSHPLIEQMKLNTSIVPTRAFLQTKLPLMAVNELVATVWNIYASSDCGLEFSHLSEPAEVEWLTSQWEKLNEVLHLDHHEQQNLAKRLLECEAFDHFMAAKFPTTKRYGCEGAESMLVVFDEILKLCQHVELAGDEASELTINSVGNINDVIIGMPHRGRLNLLACLLDFDPSAIFNKARGEPELDLREAWMSQGDVLSHLSTNTRFVYGLDHQHIGLSRDTPQPINVSLLPNPSHLEVVSPMVAGSARGRAHNLLHGYSSSPKFVSIYNNNNNNTAPDGDGTLSLNAAIDATTLTNLDGHYTQFLPTILPVQVHGDASVAGQGIIQETLQMANLPLFTVGGSVHLVVNNQIGYTTQAGRSSRYCTDIFKSIEAPVIHVNAQNIPSVVRATRLALTYRQKFGKDVAIDLICYRQHGHNEMDEPSFTQPIMYKTIRQRRSIPQSYCDEIGMDQSQRQQVVDEFKQRLQDAYKRLDQYKPDNDNYRNFNLPSEFYRDHICSWQTGCDLNLLRSVALASVNTPENFKIHPNLARVLVAERRQRFGADETATGRELVDWATGEILAFGSLLKQNQSVRLAGQDVARGTFSTRHAVLFDQNTNEPYVPLNNMDSSSGSVDNDDLLRQTQIVTNKQLEVANTILSEEAALAYEFAYSAETCALTIWEAQFGDFFNTAQSIIDTLVSSSESKWLKQSALTLLLPHGLDGAGPEHSSSHIERFLQMSSSSFDSIDTEAKVNWSVAFPTLPSQYFHLLRRQVLRPFRKPLIVMSPKVIFRRPDCVSPLADFGPGNSFKPILDDPNVSSANQVDTIVLCAGKVYFTLAEEKARNQLNNVAIVRLEELCPFPIQSLVEVIKRYPRVKSNKVVWFQEEHKNQGAYNFVATRLRNLADIKVRYIGREESELPATGSSVLHKKEHERIIKEFQLLSQ